MGHRKYSGTITSVGLSLWLPETKAKRLKPELKGCNQVLPPEKHERAIVDFDWGAWLDRDYATIQMPSGDHLIASYPGEYVQ
jgi:hypothetical protein